MQEGKTALMLATEAGAVAVVAALQECKAASPARAAGKDEAASSAGDKRKVLNPLL